jgi:hypothetical protein
LASLGLDLAHQRVLEVGAGIGDHTSFFLDRGCTVVITEPQDQNATILRERYPENDVRQIDLNVPPDDPIAADIVYCYGTLYHLTEPERALAWMARCATRLLLLETCVAAGDEDVLLEFDETPGLPENAVSGRGCRPTRPWLRRTLSEAFPYVYVPVTQPWHAEFPVDWSRPELPGAPLIRAVFVAARTMLASPALTTELPTHQPHELFELMRGAV